MTSTSDLLRIHQTVHEILKLLINGEYQRIERLSEGRRLSARQIEESIKEFPFQVVMPPIDQETELINVISVKNIPGRYSVWVNLWTKEEGRSDLSLRLTLQDIPNESFSVEVDDILVP